MEADEEQVAVLLSTCVTFAVGFAPVDFVTGEGADRI
jgi:hypothetical protein